MLRKLSKRPILKQLSFKGTYNWLIACAYGLVARMYGATVCASGANAEHFVFGTRSTMIRGATSASCLDGVSTTKTLAMHYIC